MAVNRHYREQVANPSCIEFTSTPSVNTTRTTSFPCGCREAFRDAQQLISASLHLLMIQGRKPYREGEDQASGSIRVDEKCWTWFTNARVGRERQFLQILLPTESRKTINPIYRQWCIVARMAGMHARNQLGNAVDELDDFHYWCLMMNWAADRYLIPCKAYLLDPDDIFAAFGRNAEGVDQQPDYKHSFYEFENAITSSIALCTLLEANLLRQVKETESKPTEPDSSNSHNEKWSDWFSKSQCKADTGKLFESWTKKTKRPHKYLVETNPANIQEFRYRLNSDWTEWNNSRKQ